MKKFIYLFFILSSPFAAATSFERAVFSRGCDIRETSDAASKRVCTAKAGNNAITRAEEISSIVWVQIKGCRGYVLNSCLSPQRRKLASQSGNDGGKTKVNSTSKPFSIGITGAVNYASADVAASGGTAGGLGLSVGIQGGFVVAPRFHLVVAPSYEILKLQKTIDGSSGNLVDPDPASFSQNAKYLGLSAMGGYELLDEPSFHLWGDFGAEYLYPLSATQTDSFGITETFKPGKLLFLLFGVSGDLPLDESFGMGIALQTFYNLANHSASPILGARLLLSIRAFAG